MPEEPTSFERRAQLLRPYFNTQIRHGGSVIPPPFIEEYFGTPSAGKTTLIKEMDKFLRRQGYRCYHPQEGAEVVRYIDRTTPFYNIATGTYALQILMQVSEGHQYDHVLFDRCIFDFYAWMKFWSKRGKLTRDMMVMLQESLLMAADRIDVAFIVVCEPEVAIARETKNELTSQVGHHTNTETINLLLECNRETYTDLKSRFPQLHLLDTTELDEGTMVRTAADIVLSALEKKVLAAP